MDNLKIDIISIAIFSGVYLVLFIIAEIAYHFFKVNVEYTRKFVHILTGIIALFFPIYIKGPLDLILLCGIFAIILLASLKWNFLMSVNAIKRRSRGSIMYPVVVVIAYLFQYYRASYTYFFIPILILALADPVAAWAGGKYQYKSYSVFGNSKTLGGSIAFYIVALFITGIGLFLIDNSLSNKMIACCLFIALLTSIAEAISIKGYDNLSIPVAAIIGLLIFGI